MHAGDVADIYIQPLWKWRVSAQDYNNSIIVDDY